MTIEKLYNGFVKITAIINGYLVTRKYQDYTVSTAKKMFIQETGYSKNK